MLTKRININLRDVDVQNGGIISVIFQNSGGGALRLVRLEPHLDFS